MHRKMEMPDVLWKCQKLRMASPQRMDEVCRSR